MYKRKREIIKAYKDGESEKQIKERLGAIVNLTELPARYPTEKLLENL